MMKRYINLLIISLLNFSQLFSQTTQLVLNFPNAFIYEVVQGNEKSEFWIYHNPQTGKYLYTPNDDMVKGVVGSADGTYKTYGQTEDGKKVVLLQLFPKFRRNRNPIIV